ncbi:hypothetical protein [Nitrobacter vulgaris]|nr:hypothetical protein [Nitrobacter vulgaris]
MFRQGVRERFLSEEEIGHRVPATTQRYPDVATALESIEATAYRTNQALSGVSSSISNDLASGLTNIRWARSRYPMGFPIRLYR